MASRNEPSSRQLGLLSLIGPGLLVAATGVGAGDLATASFAGHALGTACLWAVVVGGFLKFVLTEGLTRWQLATDQSLLEGVAQHFGRIAGHVHQVYAKANAILIVERHSPEAAGHPTACTGRVVERYFGAKRGCMMCTIWPELIGYMNFSTGRFPSRLDSILGFFDDNGW